MRDRLKVNLDKSQFKSENKDFSIFTFNCEGFFNASSHYFNHAPGIPCTVNYEALRRVKFSLEYNVLTGLKPNLLLSNCASKTLSQVLDNPICG